MAGHRPASRRTATCVLGAAPTMGAMPMLLRRMELELELELDGRLQPSTAAWMWSAYTACAAAITTALTAPPATAPLPVPIRAGALALTATGSAMVLAGFRRFAGPSQVTGTDAGGLVTGGAYRYSRNPQDTGLLAALTGLAISRRSPAALALTTALAGVYRAWVPIEEAHLVRHFGAPYQRYCSTTRRWIGSSTADR